jgi:DNA-binding MarR family transcriptional regulator
MADALRRPISLAEVEVATQGTRFDLLARSGWFFASDAARDLKVERGTVRQHAEKLRAQRLVVRRGARGTRRAQQWRVTPRGREVRRRLLELLEQPYEPLPEPSPVISALIGFEGDEDTLEEVLFRATGRRLEEIPGYWVSEVGDTPIAVNPA